MRILLYFSILMIALASCTNSKEEIKNETVTEITATQPASWEDYWKAFQAAAASKDAEKVKALTIFEMGISESDFEAYFDMYFSEEMYELIAATSAEGVELEPESPVNVAEARKLVLFESGYDEEEEVTYESGLFLYFGKVDNRYGLVLWMAAG